MAQLTPEQRARENIDQMLAAAGWVVQNLKDIEITVAFGVAVREFPTATGPVDYALYVDGKVIGTIEAKKEGVTLSSVEPQADRYTEGFTKTAAEKGTPYWELPLPFHYLSTGQETRVMDRRDPDYRPRDVFYFHRPETLAEWIGQAHSLRARLRTMPPVDPAGLRAIQAEALEGL